MVLEKFRWGEALHGGSRFQKTFENARLVWQYDLSPRHNMSCLT